MYVAPPRMEDVGEEAIPNQTTTTKQMPTFRTMVSGP